MTTKNKYLVDSNIFIDYSHLEPRAHEFIQNNLREIVVFYVVYFEVMTGVQNKSDFAKTKKFFEQFAFSTGDQRSVLKAIEIVDKHLLGDGIELFDAMIAATAIVNDYILVTRDTKHMGRIEGLRIKKI